MEKRKLYTLDIFLMSDLWKIREIPESHHDREAMRSTNFVLAEGIIIVFSYFF